MKEYAESIVELPNVTMVTNPSYTNIHAMDGYLGQEVLMYHGYSFDRLIDQVDGLRLAGGYEKADEIHKFLLKRRHLSPSHHLNVNLPTKEDAHIISKIPDILVSGHIHRARIGSYKNVVSISGSCWQAVTDFQLKFGHNPEPGLIPIMNLKTRKASMLSFR
jgi:DNA polymerase II small subunit